jgi:hypothetical protein
MAGDWIKMRRGLRHDPKVIAITRELAGRRDFMNWWSDPVRVTCHEHVTECVTFANVTRVTVCALLDVWAALNNAIGNDGKAPFMCLQDIDDIAEIPGFGEAMASVGWVIELEDGSLVFPNFSENNSPSKARTSTAKTDAERAAAYRARKKAEGATPDAVTPSRHVTTEKRREDSKERERAGATPPPGTPDLADQAQAVVAAYPRKEKVADALTIVLGQLRDGESFEAMLAGTKACAAVIRTLPSGPSNRYVPGAEAFFRAKRWADDPETLRRQGDAKSGSKAMSDEEALAQLGGRAVNTD